MKLSSKLKYLQILTNIYIWMFTYECLHTNLIYKENSEDHEYTVYGLLQ